MALMKCKECGGEVSSKAAACPKCGAKVAKKTSVLTWLIAGVIGLAVVIGIYDSNKRDNERAAAAAEAAAKQAAEEAKMTPAQRQAAAAASAAAQAKRKAENDAFARGAALASAARDTLKQSAHDPASFELTEAILMPTGHVCMTYRAKNGFGAVRTAQAVAMPDRSGIGTTPAQFAKHCKSAGPSLINAI